MTLDPLTLRALAQDRLDDLVGELAVLQDLLDDTSFTLPPESLAHLADYLGLAHARLSQALHLAQRHKP